MNIQNKDIHKISVGMRKEMSVTGVSEVLRFDDQVVVLKSTEGELTVEGVGLNVETLDIDRGVVELNGRIDCIFYSENSSDEKRGLFSKIFR